MKVAFISVIDNTLDLKILNNLKTHSSIQFEKKSHKATAIIMYLGPRRFVGVTSLGDVACDVTSAVVVGQFPRQRHCGLGDVARLQIKWSAGYV